MMREQCAACYEWEDDMDDLEKFAVWAGGTYCGAAICAVAVIIVFLIISLVE